MKKTIFLILGALIFAPMSSFAFKSAAGDTLNLTTPIDGDYYVAGGTVNLNALVGEDLTIAGGKIYINSSIGKDLTALGGDIIINGSIGETAKIAGGTIDINGTIEKDAVIAGGNITISKESNIKWDAMLGAWVIKLDGITNNVNLNAGEIILQGTIKGDATIRAEKIKVETGAIILGNLDYQSAKQNSGLENIVSGKVTFKQMDFEKGDVMGFLSGFIGVKFFFLLIFGLILVLVGHKRLTKPFQTLKEGIRPSLAYGFLIYAGLPFAAILVCLTIIGVPFGLLLLAIFAFLIAFYKLFNVYFYTTLSIERRGGYEKLKTWKKVWILLGWVIISTIISTIDIILTFFALGAVIKSYYDHKRSSK